MRVTGGEFCGRILAVPGSGAIRPTQDRVRAALFNILAPEIAGAEFLDLFAGSGAVGIEALSRGAGRAVFVERDRRNLAVLKGNLEMLGADGRAETVAADAYRWVASYSGGGFGVAFADRDNPHGDIFEDADDALRQLKSMKQNGYAIY